MSPRKAGAGPEPSQAPTNTPLEQAAPRSNAAFAKPPRGSEAIRVLMPPPPVRRQNEPGFGTYRTRRHRKSIQGFLEKLRGKHLSYNKIAEETQCAQGERSQWA